VLELMILVLLIAILAVIVIPRIMGTGRKAREASLRADLKSLRDGIERFEGACAAFPPALSDLMVANGNDISADTDGRGLSVDRRGYNGPYLVTEDRNLPEDPFTKAADWNYNSATGEVRSSSTLSSLGGIPYADW